MGTTPRFGHVPLPATIRACTSRKHVLERNRKSGLGAASGVRLSRTCESLTPLLTVLPPLETAERAPKSAVQTD